MATSWSSFGYLEKFSLLSIPTFPPCFSFLSVDTHRICIGISGQWLYFPARGGKSGPETGESPAGRPAVKPSSTALGSRRRKESLLIIQKYSPLVYSDAKHQYLLPEA